MTRQLLFAISLCAAIAATPAVAENHCVSPEQTDMSPAMSGAWHVYWDAATENDVPPLDEWGDARTVPLPEDRDWTPCCANNGWATWVSPPEQCSSTNGLCEFCLTGVCAVEGWIPIEYDTDCDGDVDLEDLAVLHDDSPTYCGMPPQVEMSSSTGFGEYFMWYQLAHDESEISFDHYNVGPRSPTNMYGEDFALCCAIPNEHDDRVWLWWVAPPEACWSEGEVCRVPDRGVSSHRFTLAELDRDCDSDVDLYDFAAAQSADSR